MGQSSKTELLKEERLYYLRSATFNPPSLHFCHLCTRILLTFQNSQKVFQFSRILNPSHTAAELSKLAKLTISKFLQSLSVHAKSENIFAELKLSLCNQTCNRSLSVQVSSVSFSYIFVCNKIYATRLAAEIPTKSKQLFQDR